MKCEFTSKNPRQTYALAAELAAELTPGAILALYGELGAGKTCFIQGLAQALGVKQAVSSPTYTIVNEYNGDMPVYHMDLYRISDADEALHLGLDDYLYGEGVTAIEWPEIIGELLPPSAIRIFLSLGEGLDDRLITIQADSLQLSAEDGFASGGKHL